VGLKPFSLSSVAFTNTITRIACLLVSQNLKVGLKPKSLYNGIRTVAPAQPHTGRCDIL
jgi:hypothetical protein